MPAGRVGGQQLHQSRNIVSHASNSVLEKTCTQHPVFTGLHSDGMAKRNSILQGHVCPLAQRRSCQVGSIAQKSHGSTTPHFARLRLPAEWKEEGRWVW